MTHSRPKAFDFLRETEMMDCNVAQVAAGVVVGHGCIGDGQRVIGQRKEEKENYRDKSVTAY
ncbi:MAG: hypothetical protein BM485_02040 [Desulfobulbaceae bacterium DB1]|nr:MAG: hypothetical protein BM485_02040 [Desulfobulbaceae bacterium DB1]